MRVPQPDLIALTGAHGFIGAALQRGMVSKAKAFRIIDREKYTVAGAYEGAGAVIHLAGLAHRLSGRPEDYMRINCDLAIDAAKAAAAAGVKRFVYVSSSKALCEFWHDETPLTEDQAPQPTCDYGISKHRAEIRLLELHREGVIEIVIVRPALVLGAPPKANLGTLAKAAMSPWSSAYGLFFAQFTAKKSFTTLENLCSALLLLARHQNAPGKIFHVIDRPALSTHELFRLLNSAKTTLLPEPGLTTSRTMGASPSPEAAVNGTFRRLVGWLIRHAFIVAGRGSTHATLASPLVLSGERIRQELGFDQADKINDELRRIVGTPPL